MLAVRAAGISKSFGSTAAIRDLSLEIESGTVCGLIGPDGAGKSTLLRLLVGLLALDSGRIEIADTEAAGLPIELKDRIGYMPQRFSLYGDLTVAENMRFFADYYAVPRARYEERKAELFRFSGLGPFQDRFAGNLSGGMQKKLALTCNLLHSPEILFLDEPTTGVDPVSRREFWRLIEEVNGQGATILFTTPYMDEAARCGRVGFLFEGRLLVHDSPANLIRTMEGRIAEIIAARPHDALRTLKGADGIKSVYSFGESIHAVFEEGRGDLEAVRRALSEQGQEDPRLRMIPPSFEDVFLALAERRPG